MKWLDNIATVIGDNCVDLLNTIEDYKPQIYIGLGIIGMGVTVISAIKNSRKIDAIIDRHREKMAEIDKLNDRIEEYGVDDVAEVYSEEYGTDKNFIYKFNYTNAKLGICLTTGLNFARAFASTTALFALSTASTLHGLNILNGRLLGAVAAFNAVSEEFMSYRDRVKKSDGEEWDNYYRTGFNKPKKHWLDEDDTEYDESEFYTPHEGDLVEGRDDIDPEDIVSEEVAKERDKYRLVFGPNCKAWTGNPGVDLLTLQGTEDMFTDRLLVKGRVVQNEVLDRLGADLTEDGTICGWRKGKGDNFVSVGLEQIKKDPSRTVWCKDGKAIYILEFNVDGLVIDFDKKKKKTA